MVDDFGLPLDDEDLEELMCSNGAAVPFLQVRDMLSYALGKQHALNCFNSMKMSD